MQKRIWLFILSLRALCVVPFQTKAQRLLNQVSAGADPD